jgi:MATE family multidrug resistance protein
MFILLIMNQKILRIAVPSIISNITVPLLSLVDVAIVGHLGSQTYIGAIAVGSLVFNIVYWLFGFLRMGTSGMTSQRFGARRLDEAGAVLTRVLAIAGVVSLLLIVFQRPIAVMAERIVGASPDVWREALVYYDVCVWGAPAVLGSFCFAGWFVGMQNSRFPMIVAIAQNIINIALSLLLVEVFGMKVAGVATGTLVAQYSGLALAFFLWFRYYKRRTSARFSTSLLLDKAAMGEMFAVNRSIFLRTLCLIAVTTYFTSFGARQGDTILAINTLLMQFFTLFSYVMDGFAYSGEALAGRYVGASNYVLLKKMTSTLFIWGWSLTALFTVFYIFGGDMLLSLLTDDASVSSAAREYIGWVALVPVCGFAAFLWDGVLIGATRTNLMLYSMLMASCVFFALSSSLSKQFGNDALWIAFLAYLSVRGVAEWFMWRICRQCFG